jgi:hypothetical protein
VSFTARVVSVWINSDLNTHVCVYEARQDGLCTDNVTLWRVRVILCYKYEVPVCLLRVCVGSGGTASLIFNFALDRVSG